MDGREMKEQFWNEREKIIALLKSYRATIHTKSLCDSMGEFIARLESITKAGNDWNEIKLDGLPPLDMWCAWWDKDGHREPTVGFRGPCDIELWWEGYTHWMELPCI